jgi:hypothetical protein
LQLRGVGLSRAVPTTGRLTAPRYTPILLTMISSYPAASSRANQLVFLEKMGGRGFQVSRHPPARPPNLVTMIRPDPTARS